MTDGCGKKYKAIALMFVKCPGFLSPCTGKCPGFMTPCTGSLTTTPYSFSVPDYNGIPIEQKDHSVLECGECGREFVIGTDNGKYRLIEIAPDPPENPFTVFTAPDGKRYTVRVEQIP